MAVVGLLLFLLSACASYKTQYAEEPSGSIESMTAKEGTEVFYLLGDAGDAGSPKGNQVLHALKSMVRDQDTKTDHLIFLGDNVYDHGMGGVEYSDKRKDAERGKCKQEKKSQHD